ATGVWPPSSTPAMRQNASATSIRRWVTGSESAGARPRDHSRSTSRGANVSSSCGSTFRSLSRSRDLAHPIPVNPTPPRRLCAWRWILLLVLGPVLLAFVLVTGGAWWIWTTTTGLRTAVLVVNTFVPGVAITQVDGTLADGFQVGKVVLRFGGTGVTIDDLAMQPKQWTPYSTRIDVERISARRVAIDWDSKPSSAPPPTPLGIPLEQTIRQGQIGELAIGARGAEPRIFRRL